MTHILDIFIFLSFYLLLLLSCKFSASYHFPILRYLRGGVDCPKLLRSFTFCNVFKGLSFYSVKFMSYVTNSLYFTLWLTFSPSRFRKKRNRDIPDANKVKRFIFYMITCHYNNIELR